MPTFGGPHQQGRGRSIAHLASFVVGALLFLTPIVILRLDFFNSPPRWALLVHTAGLVIVLGNVLCRVFTHRTTATEADTSPTADSSTRHQ
jgi:cytochrome c biogenesis protein CcdA